LKECLLVKPFGQKVSGLHVKAARAAESLLEKVSNRCGLGAEQTMPITATKPNETQVTSLLTTVLNPKENKKMKRIFPCLLQDKRIRVKIHFFSATGEQSMKSWGVSGRRTFTSLTDSARTLTVQLVAIDLERHMMLSVICFQNLARLLSGGRHCVPSTLRPT
jgi:hypothetical protein